MKLETIRKKARTNLLEVEHVVTAAKERVPGLQQELLRLSDELGWSPTPFRRREGTWCLAKWALVAGAYADGGIAALGELAREKDNRHFVVAMLIEVRSPEAAAALFDMFADVLAAPSWDCQTSKDLIPAFNSLFIFSEPVTPTDAQAATARAFLMTLYAAASTVAQRAHVVCALRGVGDRSTIEFRTHRPERRPIWSASGGQTDSMHAPGRCMLLTPSGSSSSGRHWLAGMPVPQSGRRNKRGRSFKSRKR